PVKQLLLAEQVLVLGHVHRVAKRGRPARDNRQLEERVRMRQEPARDRMAGLVIGDRLALLGREHLAALLKPPNNALNGRLKVRLSYLVRIATAGNKRRLIADIRN